MAQGTLKIHSENILPIIKKWLYTDREIFLRELISNSCDAMSKLRILRDQGKCDFKDEELRISVAIDKEKKCITVTDTGLGMSSEEVEKYIAQLAFSGAEEFVKQHKEEKEGNEMIGHFGLGFYSSFMVSRLVEIDTLSYAEGASAAHWSCDGSTDYTLEEGERSERGTCITLHLNEEDEEFLEESRLREMLLKHCRFLPYPIYLSEERINEKEPLWIKSPSECSEQDYIDFYHTLYPMEGDPIFWIHLNVDYPFNLQGILYFPKMGRRLDPKELTLQLYCNRVFVSDNCKDVIPDYLNILRGVIDSPDIPLNVSRSNLQMDRTVRQLGNHIAKKVSDTLTGELTRNRESYIKKWPNIELIIKLGILQDEKFYDRVKSALIWKSSKEEWTTLEEYLERSSDKKVYYHQDETHPSPLFDLYKEKGVEILFTPSHIDNPVIAFLERKISGVKFQRLDGAIDDAIIDSSREKTVLDADGKTEAVKIADSFRSLLKADEIEIEAKSLASDVPAFVMVSEQERRLKEYFALSGQEFPSMDKKGPLVVNTNSPLVDSIHKLKSKDPKLAASLAKQLYQLSLLSQGELDKKELSPFLKRSIELLEKLSLLSCQ